ncbi:MAG: LysM peptidoglycan-binding domain-containing protein [Lachnospiraceae bacterium]|nr:LysM peptidoglycan-binding domain-containing protein [Lachnospiraceae bacterium]
MNTMKRADFREYVTAEQLRSEGKAARAKARRRKRLCRRLLTFAMTLVFIWLVCLAGTKAFGRAKGSTERTKVLTSVYVENGDSLWSIAEKYYTPECGDMKDYVREIKRTNGLNSDTILYGYTLLVPYFK